jgi:uncharacterized membrane protein
MATLVAIGYPDETTAALASQEAQRLARDLIVEPDAIAMIIRDRGGKLHVTTNHRSVGGGASWACSGVCCSECCFSFPFFGMAVGAALGALMGTAANTGIDRGFQNQVRDMLKPGMSALFLVVEKATPDRAVETLSRFGGTVLKSSLSKHAEVDLQAATATA